MVNKIKLFNKLDEKLDLWIEGKLDAKITVVFVHGFAVDKHETARYFDDVSKVLSKIYRVVRFDLSGCGESEGKLEEKDYQKWSEDLNVVLGYVKKTFPGRVFIIAHSMGCFVTSLASPDGVDKVVFSGIPNSNTDDIIKRIVSHFAKRPGGNFDPDGVSIFPRSSGAIQKIGSSFWKVLKVFRPVDELTKFGKKTNLFIIHMNQDQLIGMAHLEEYKNIKGITIKWLDGDHSFTKRQERERLIEEVKNFFQ